MNVAYLGWCPTQTAYTAYSIVQGRAETFGGAGAQNIKGAHENMKQGFK